jgi:hypothetical protein
MGRILTRTLDEQKTTLWPLPLFVAWAARVPYAGWAMTATRLAMLRAAPAVIGVLLGAGCGPAPYAMGPEEAEAPEGRAPEGRGPAVVVLVGQASGPQAPAPRAAPAEDRWIPDAFPRSNPFAARRTWVGDYDCIQGTTGLALRVIDVRGKRVRAVFDFHHAASGAAGQYIVGGAFDEESGRVTFEPGPWIIHPDGYLSVSMEGQVSADGTRFLGRILYPGCGMVRLHAAR